MSIHLNDSKVRAREFEGLKEALESFKLTNGTIITENEESTETITKDNKKFTIEIIPVWKWLLQK